MDDACVSAPGFNRRDQFRPPFPVQPPHHLVEAYRHREHRASLGSVRAPGDERLDLPLGRPPIVNRDRMVDEDDRVGSADPPLDRRPRTIAVYQPPRLRKQRFMSSREFRLRRENPIWLPLDFVDGVIRQGMSGAERLAIVDFPPPALPITITRVMAQTIPV